ncbi:hypothetical protein [Streptomyces sp. AP-93]|uniref:hypothetical protein n=1 Tax=Streptomyces sp. AP-93 TaxID=2929048 RepID=UPI001FAF6ED4|nr:hypothetical protein [Streptomyces sp. AP-93]MCJ0869490.1 hypothetical protein [Streptomyces sp. AP-93]
MAVRHAAPEKDQLGTFLTAGCPGRTVGLLGLAVDHQQNSDAYADHTAAVPDTERTVV